MNWTCLTFLPLDCDHIPGLPTMGFWSRSCAIPLNYMPAVFWRGFCSSIIIEYDTPGWSYDCIRLDHFQRHILKDGHGINWVSMPAPKACELLSTVHNACLRGTPMIKSLNWFLAVCVLQYHKRLDPSHSWELQDIPEQERDNNFKAMMMTLGAIIQD